MSHVIYSILNSVLKMKTREVVWVQNGCKLPSCLLDAWELRLAAAQHHERVFYCRALDQESIQIQSMVSAECVLLFASS